MSESNLVRMANQIGKFFAPKGDDAVIAGVSDHLAKYWDPRMKTQIFAHLDAGGAGLEPAVLKAVERLREGKK